MDWLVPILVALIAGPSLGALTNWWIKRRQSSGSISTSDAASLWKESENLRKEYRERAEQLEKQLEDVNTKLQSVMEELNALKSSSKDMAAKIESLKAIIAKLQEENKRLLALKGQNNG